MDAMSAQLLGKYVGAATACFGPALIGAVVGRQFENRWVGVCLGALGGGSAFFALRFLILGAI